MQRFLWGWITERPSLGLNRIVSVSRTDSCLPREERLMNYARHLVSTCKYFNGSFDYFNGSNEIFLYIYMYKTKEENPISNCAMYLKNKDN